MRFSFQRYLKGQTPLGVFHNLDIPGDCDGIKYVEVHVGTWRFTLMFRERGF